MNDPVDLLGYPVRWRVLARYLGQLGLVLAVLTLAPLGVAVAFGEYGIAARYVLVLGALAPASVAGARVRAPAGIQTNEALSIIALTFVATPVLMVFPTMGAGLTLSTALFENVSAVTTTGLTMLDDIDGRSRAFLFARAWMQWYGGLGFVVLLLALVMGYDAAARRLVGPLGADTLPTTARTHARRMLGVYVILTLLGFFILRLALGDAFTALLHVLTAVSTGGFSPYDASLGETASWGSRYAVVGVAILGAIPLPLYLHLRSHPGRLIGDEEFRALIVSMLVTGALVSLLLGTTAPTGVEALRHGLLLGISAQTTTGYTSMRLEGTNPAVLLVLVAAMFVGGGLGSTAGGVKLFRFLILIRLARLAVRRTALAPHAVTPAARMGGRTLTDDDTGRALLLVVMYLMAALVSWFVFLMHGYRPMDSLFEVVSAIGTVGLSTGVTGPNLPPALQATLSLDMLLGRLEIFALLVLCYPRTWIGKRTE